MTRVALVSVVLPLSACSLIGLEPDEIDVADEDTGDETGGLTGLDSTGGEASTGGTEGESGDGDGDNDDSSSGDGDGDTGDPGDGDGDPNTGDGDGDGDPLPCAELGPTPVELGPNPVALAGPGALASECGHPGPEGVYSFTAPAAGGYDFALIDADFEGALYPLDGECAPASDLCVASPELLTLDLELGEVALVVVDSSAGGSGTLEIIALP